MNLTDAPDTVDAVVIGAGVVGLAVARALAREGREVVVLEAERAIGTHTSSRNSEVIHAGFYYPTGSWKARLCAASANPIVAPGFAKAGAGAPERSVTTAHAGPFPGSLPQGDC